MGYGLKVIASQYYEKGKTNWYTRESKCRTCNLDYSDHRVAYDEKDYNILICEDGTENQPYELWHGYMSFNQSVHKNIWYVPRDFNQQTVGEVLKSLDTAIQNIQTLETVVVESETGIYATGVKNFMYLLQDLRDEICELPLDAICLNDYV